MAAGERIYEISFGCTSQDLNELRDELILLTVQSGNYPTLMNQIEFIGPKANELIKNYISNIDIFVAIIGTNYGDLAEGQEKSYIQQAYDHARNSNKQIIVFLQDEEPRAGDLEAQKMNNYYIKFRNHIIQETDGLTKVTIPFKSGTNIDSLQAEYNRVLRNCIANLRSKGGWVRGTLYDRMIRLDEKVSRNPFFQKFADQLSAYNVLSNRCSEEVPELKKAIAEYFWNQYLGRMVVMGIRNIYFESGSSIAYVSQSFIERLKKKQWVSDKAQEFRIETNNILTYLDFVLSVPIKIDLFPYGTPEAKYGATFGPLMSVAELQPPIDKEPYWSLDTDAVSTLASIRSKFKENYEKNGLILMTASGIDTNSPKFPGPHVGSYYNMLFKKAILESFCPTIIFLDETKLPESFIEGTCFPICDDKMSWKNICSTHPIGIAIATNDENHAHAKLKILSEFGLNNIEQKENDNGIWTLIATNDIFKALWRPSGNSVTS